MENDEYSVQDALRDVRGAREAASARVVTPWWYHPTLGLVIGALILSLGLPLGGWLSLGVVVPASVVIVVLVAAYRRSQGVWVTAREAGPRARPLQVGFGLAVAALVVVALLDRFAWHAIWPVYAAAVAAFLGAVAVGPRLDQRLRDDIAAGGQR